MAILVCASPLPSEGSNLTPAHHYNDFRFKTYAPVAFRYFRELFGIRPDDYLVSWCSAQAPGWGVLCVMGVLFPLPERGSAVRPRGRLCEHSSGGRL